MNASEFRALKDAHEKVQTLSSQLQSAQEKLKAMEESHKHDHEGITAYSKALFGRDDVGYTDGLREIEHLKSEADKLELLSQQPNTLAAQALEFLTKWGFIVERALDDSPSVGTLDPLEDVRAFLSKLPKESNEG